MVLFLTYLILCALMFSSAIGLYIGLKTIKLI